MARLELNAVKIASIRQRVPSSENPKPAHPNDPLYTSPDPRNRRKFSVSSRTAVKSSDYPTARPEPLRRKISGPVDPATPPRPMHLTKPRDRGYKRGQGGR
ncbi:hypothetical protein T440DRAFT_536256 [Plenodomus tracheiphilus IPT5]|uniref:Uncharacterized protein n=1 Tax=Plenodomus tracheiphilus IPT5 TaxID=1408161 RepID=A0A6A7B2A4_9PLEO|nr:hypothetical protein T440DRAFT_536256 [Plenodomus tracheiphilus IPT5]